MLTGRSDPAVANVTAVNASSREISAANAVHNRLARAERESADRSQLEIIPKRRQASE